MPHFTKTDSTRFTQDGTLGSYSSPSGWVLEYGENRMTHGEYGIILWWGNYYSMQRIFTDFNSVSSFAGILLDKLGSVPLKEAIEICTTYGFKKD